MGVPTGGGSLLARGPADEALKTSAATTPSATAAAPTATGR
jgi:hypothetical protein